MLDIIKSDAISGRAKKNESRIETLMPLPWLRRFRNREAGILRYLIGD